MSRRLTDMRWDEKGSPANLQAAAADALLWLDIAILTATEKRKIDPEYIPRMKAVRKQLEKYLSVDARTKGMP